jgi:sugar/nucleoside kinase (ribokinase family)
MVWDTIRDRGGRRVEVQEWGGMAYALAALEATLPQGWEIVPLVKVGRDLSEAAFRFLRGLPRVDVEAGVRVVDEPNNRVEIRYVDQDRRTERLSGGVPPWLWTELAPAARTCDALYVNFISGFEMSLDTAQSLRASFEGPTYADLHSLFLGIGRGGVRVPQELAAWANWLRCFDAIQLNEDEFELLGRSWGDPWELAAQVVGPELKLIAVTLGDRGAAYVAAGGFETSPDRWPQLRRRVGVAGTPRSGRVPVVGGRQEGDPTGCGDVWGATFFGRLLSGDDLDSALGGANRMAAKNVIHQGADGLHHFLGGRLDTRGGRA